MKKVSTAATKQSRNFSQQKLTIGLDLGDRSSYYCVLDEIAQIVMEQKVSTTPKLCKRHSARCRTRGSRSKSARIRPGSVACSASWDTK
jgi:hypothetical protein